MRFKQLLLLIFLQIPAVLCQDIVRGISWFGFETQYFNLMCTWKHDIWWNVREISRIGFNYIRVPFSLQFVEKDYWADMDELFRAADQHNLSLQLDFHRLHSDMQSPVPFDAMYSFDDFLAAWRIILDRYHEQTHLRSLDIFNEFQGDDAQQWSTIAQEIVLYIENLFPDRFEYYVQGTDWSNDISGVFVDTTFDDRIVYSLHKYSFSTPDEGDPFASWAASFGDIAGRRVSVGEFGYRTGVREDEQFIEQFVAFLHRQGISDNSFFWTWTYNSGDTGGILRDDCETIDHDKVAVLEQLWGLNQQEL